MSATPHLRDGIAKATATDHYGDRLAIEIPTSRQRLMIWTRQDHKDNEHSAYGPDGGYLVFGPSRAGDIRALRDALTQWLDLQ